MNKNKLWIAFGLLFLAGCLGGSEWPPAVTTVDEIKALPSDTVHIRGIGITDREISVITERFPELCYIYINSRSKITNKSLADLAQLKHLRKVAIINCSLLTDDGFKNFLLYPALKELSLENGPQITGRGVQNLSFLKHLQLLDLSGGMPQVTINDIDHLRQAIPNCNIRVQ